MVKIQANTVALLLMVSSPNNQVSPSSGNKITIAFSRVLYINSSIGVKIYYYVRIIMKDLLFHTDSEAHTSYLSEKDYNITFEMLQCSSFYVYCHAYEHE